jgi:cyclophilin family peptidyl-prolyl cis-trans isomerase/HEAT repeat protein
VERLARHGWALSGCAAGLLALSACQAPPTSVGIEQSPLFAEIALLEDARDPSGGALLRFMRHPDPDLRVRAATALGRMPFPEHGAEVTDALLRGLEDGDASVRAEAAFALGLRGDPRAGPALVELAVHRTRRDRVALVRARATEAASKLPLVDLRLELLRALRDESSQVRLEAVQGTHRWGREEPTAAEVDRLLLEHLDFEGERDVLAMTLFSLGHRRAPGALDAFLEHAASRQPMERLWSVRGLRELEPNERTLRVLVMATRDVDWRVAYEATAALGAYHLGEQAGALLAAAESLNPHVRRASWEALARRLAGVTDPAELAQAKAWKVAFDERTPLRDPSPSVRAAFGAALVLYERLAGSHRVSREEVAERLAEQATSTEEWVAFAAALAQDLPAVGPPGPETLAVLELLAEQPDLRIAGAALAAIGDLRDESARPFLHAALANPDNGLRLAAVQALRGMPSAADLEPLAEAYRTSAGDVGAEVRFNALRNLGALEGPRATELLREATHDADPYVRRVAAEELARRAEPPADTAPVEPGAPPAEAEPPAEAGPPEPEPAVYRRNPRVRISTTRGDMVFELFPREAPVHVHNFLTLAERGHYAGTIFHRVVPDFVIQGGDYRGDGNGGTTYRGEDALRHEIGPRKYVRGSLGMPRNEDPDSGGSQFFVTHRPTPHLDGRYTIFGELRAGFEVLDAIEVGDRILEVKRVARR